MHYNTNLIKSNVISLLDYNIVDCFNSAYLNNLYKNYKLQTTSKNMEDGRVKLKIDILENYIVYLLEKESLTKGEQKIIDFASEYYYNLIKEDKFFSFDSFIISKASIVGNKFFNGSRYNEVSEILKNKYKYIRINYDLYMKDELTNSNDIVRLMEFMISKIGEEKYLKYQEGIVNKLLNSDNNYSLCEKNFLFQFFNHKKCSGLGIDDSKIYISNIDLMDGSEIKEITRGMSYGSSGLISFNRNSALYEFNKKSASDNLSYLAKSLAVINHEIQHYYQSSMLSRGYLNNSSYNMIKNRLFREYKGSSNYDEYSENYKYRETEIEANIEGYRDVARIFEIYSKDKRSNEIDDLYRISHKINMQKATGYQRDINSNNNKKMMEEYNIRNLMGIIKKHPDVLNMYPQLKYFFNKTGEIKPFSEFLNYYTILSVKLFNSNSDSKEISDVEECFQEFFTYYLSNMDINSLSFDNSIDYENMLSFFRLVGRNLFYECEKLKDMCKTFDENNIKDFVHIKNIRIDRINKYYEFLKKNKDIIEKLDKYNQSKLGERHRLFKHYYLEEDRIISNIKSTNDYINNIESNYSVLKESEYAGRKLF